MFSYYVAYVCIVYIDMSTENRQTIYCEKSTVDETGHFTWAMFGKDDKLIISTIMLKTHTESRRNLIGYIPLDMYS